VISQCIFALLQMVNPASINHNRGESSGISPDG
jgi:hypothetical protein